MLCKFEIKSLPTKRYSQDKSYTKRDDFYKRQKQDAGFGPEDIDLCLFPLQML